MVATTTAAAAVRGIRPGSRVWVGSGCAVPLSLLAALEATGTPDIEYLSYLLSATGPEPARYRHRTFLVSGAQQKAVEEGRVEYVPMALAEVPRLLATGRLRVDAALLQVTPPDARGFVSLGISVDLAQAILETGCPAIAEINPNMPRTHGQSHVPAARFEALVETAAPIVEYIHPPAGEAIGRIARYVAALIEDGSTLQFGLGRLPAETMKHLAHHRDLGLHDDVLTDGIVDLALSGALTGARKNRYRYRIVGSTAFGTRKLYDFVHDNPGIAMLPIDQVADPLVIAEQHRMVSVMQAFAIDVTGQPSVDQYDGRVYGGVSTLNAFMRGAARSQGGKSILCLASLGPDGQSAIRPSLRAGESAGIARSGVHYVVTEWGIAHLFGRSVRERALALIEIAHPNFRDALLKEAAGLGYLRPGQQLASQRAWPVEEERRVRLKDGAELLVRPSRAGDAEALRDLFHRMRPEDQYTRFFRRMRSLSQAEAESLCNVNHDSEVAFLAVTGERDAETVIASAVYFVNPETNMAEVAFMVAPDFQNRGLGTAMQAVLADFARRKGVRGFVVETLRGNRPMWRLAMAAPGTKTIESEDDIVRVTTLFG